MDAGNPMISMSGLGFSYPSGRKVLENVSFDLPEGSRVGLIGPNGSGKTTFLFVIMGLLRHTSGTLKVLGHPVSKDADFFEVRRNVGFCFQNADDQLFSPTVLEDVAFGPLNLGQPPEQARETALKTLKALHLEGFENRVSYRLSGGEKKLVSLATILAMDPKILILDEPTTGLDEATNEHLVSILNRLKKPLLIVSHEYDFLSRTVKDIYCMDHGQVAYSGDTSVLHTHTHLHPGGQVPHKHRDD